MARSPRLNPDVIRARLTVAADRLAERGDGEAGADHVGVQAGAAGH
ncbi:hypothetical protein [Streptomyces scabiei]|nr:hypothetical protein [Streptomyces scabiei]MDX3283521.1 hypothetical protein [Streptomyces scabiei]